MSDPVTYEEWAIGTAKTLSHMLRDLEARMAANIDAGNCPYGFPEDATPKEVVAGAVLMVVCGMLADEEDGGGRSLVLRAADKFKNMGLPGAEEIRVAADVVFDTLGAKRQRHRWN